MEELYELLDGLNMKVDFRNEKALIEDGILESLDIVIIVDELNSHYDIEITVDDLIPENFDSAEAMLELVRRLQDEE